jgi:hypothetical protein
MSIKTEKQQVEDLWKLVNAAEKEAERYRDDWVIDEEDSQYISYRNSCYYNIRDYFWDIASKLGKWLDDYDIDSLSTEQAMRKYLENYENSN